MFAKSVQDLFLELPDLPSKKINHVHNTIIVIVVRRKLLCILVFVRLLGS